MWTKVAGAASALVVSGLGAAPAGAETATAQREVSFTVGGKEVTCTFSGRSEYDAEDWNGPVTQIDFGTDLLDGDKRCTDALELVSATLTYRRSGVAHDEYATADGPGPSVGGHIIVRDAVEQAVVTHSVRFPCDEVTSPGACQFTVFTDPISVNSK